MNSAHPFIAYWYFHIPNFILAALMYTAMGRFVLGFIFDERSDNFIWRFFVRVTEPLVTFVSYFTPLAVPRTLVLLLAVVWLFAARAALLILLLALGIAPTPGVTPQ